MTQAAWAESATTSSCAGEAMTLLMLMSLMMKSGLYHQPAVTSDPLQVSQVKSMSPCVACVQAANVGDLFMICSKPGWETWYRHACRYLLSLQR